MLRDLSRAKKNAFYSHFKGHTLSVLIEHRKESGQLRGLSRNYLFCAVEGDDALIGTEVNITLVGSEADRALGRLSESPQPPVPTTSSVRPAS